MPATRAQVEGQLTQLEQVGYQPGVSDVHYPTQLHVAQARLDQQAGASSYGPSSAGLSQSGGVSSGTAGQQPVYFGH